MSPSEFKLKEKELSRAAWQMQRENIEHDLKDLVDDPFWELKPRAQARARATATARVAKRQLRQSEPGVTEESIENARLEPFLNGCSVYVINAW